MTDEQHTRPDDIADVETEADLAVEQTTEHSAAADSDAVADEVVADAWAEEVDPVGEPDPDRDRVDGEAGVPPQYGVGPFSVREIALIGVWLAAFVVSFFPVTATLSGSFLDVTLTWGSVWQAGISWILTIGVPTAAVFLIVLRRFSPDGIRRIGSLGIDQFASVAFSVAAVIWLGWVWESVSVAIQTGMWTRSWVIWVELVLMLAGVVLTVFAPFIPTLKEDFEHRREITAHRVARPLRPVTRRPASERAPRRPADAAPAPEGYAGAGSGAAEAYAATQYGAYEAPAGAPTADPYAHAADEGHTGPIEEFDSWADTGAHDPFQPVVEPEADDVAEPVAPVRQQAFWALVPEERDIVDEAGVPLFRIGPTAWALVIEDRTELFVVRHEDGRTGYLHDISDVTRG